MDEDLEFDMDDLATDEVRELLLDAGAEISLDQAEELARLVRDAGGLEEAVEALQIISSQRAA